MKLYWLGCCQSLGHQPPKRRKTQQYPRLNNSIQVCVLNQQQHLLAAQENNILLLYRNTAQTSKKKEWQNPQLLMTYKEGRATVNTVKWWPKHHNQLSKQSLLVPVTTVNLSLSLWSSLLRKELLARAQQIASASRLQKGRSHRLRERCFPVQKG